MRRNFSNSPCPACGVVIRGNAELPFVSRKAWRDQVAEALNYNKEFIQSFGVRTFHFNEYDIRNGSPVGLPSLNIIRVDDWPVMATNTNLIINEPNPVSDENDIVNVEAIDEIEMDENEDPKEMPNFVIVEISQLKLLFYQCQFCGNPINETVVHMAHKGGVFHVKYYCSKCNRRRFWSSSQKPLSPIMSASALLNGFPISKLVRFFLFLNCAFPSVRRMFHSAQTTVRPIIVNFYENKRQTLLQALQGLNLNLTLDGQYDSPGYCAYYCTVTTMEASTRKIIGFKTVETKLTTELRMQNLQHVGC